MNRPTAVRVRLWTLLVSAPLIAQCAPAAPLPRGETPSLVVMIVVDQARYEYLERFRHLYKGGLAYLLDNGTVFSDAHQNHAITATAPGHASLSTGMEPARSGIVGNNWFDRATLSNTYSAGLTSNPSPVNLEVTAIGDWLKEKDPRSKVFTASAKDRSAVLLGGQGPDGAYWYDRRWGTWRSSDYYVDAERPWMEAFHQRRLLDQYFATAWEPLVGEHAWPDADIEQLDRGAFEWQFPYAIGGYSLEPEASFYSGIYATPFVDWYLLEFAKALVHNEQLGADGSVDFLGLSFAALDSVGHTYGPNSPEVVDVLCRLDLYLQELLDFIDAEVGLEHVVFALSADHGVVAMPEYQTMTGAPGKRLGVEDVLCVQRAGSGLDDRFGAGDWLLSGFYLNEATIAARGLVKADVEQALAERVAECGAVQRVWTATEMNSTSPDQDPYAQMFRNNYFAGRSPDLRVQFRPYFLYYPGTSTSHGSVYAYDSQVPIIIAGPGVAAATVASRVNTVDLAPTLARLVGVQAPEGLDGVELNAMLESASSESWQ